MEPDLGYVLAGLAVYVGLIWSIEAGLRRRHCRDGRDFGAEQLADHIIDTTKKTGR